MKPLQVLAVTAAISTAVTVAIALFLNQRPEPAPVVAPATTPTAAPPAKPVPEEITIAIPNPSEEEMREIKYLPTDAALPRTAESRILAGKPMREGNRRLVGVRAITNKATHGELLNPQWSPDGLQMLASRPGFDGLIVVDVRTGAFRRIADVSGWGARWTADGNIEARDADGNALLLAADGTLISKGAAPAPSIASVENDAVFVTTPDGTRLPLTTRDDKYFDPIVSPDGKQIVFQGLTTGMYVAPADGSAPPVSIGYGAHPTWMPDGSGLVFAVTSDDGHILTEGDIVLVDSKLEEINHLTKGDGKISQRPTVRPGGKEVAFEADGEVFVGTLQ